MKYFSTNNLWLNSLIDNDTDHHQQWKWSYQHKAYSDKVINRKYSHNIKDTEEIKDDNSNIH